jgi:hypothetical protein
MSRIVIYSPAGPIVSNRVTAYLLSANTPDFDGEPNKLVNPDLTSVADVLQKYWKVDTGTVVEMTAEEKIAIDAEVEPIVPFPVGVYNSPDEQVNWPMTSGTNGSGTRTPIMLSNRLPPKYQFYGAGCGDKWEDPAEIGGGAVFQISQTDQGSSPLEFGFLDHVYLLGGQAQWQNAAAGDYVNCELFTPASVCVEGTPTGDQVGIIRNEIVPSSGLYVYVPYSTPTHYVDPVKYAGTEVEQYLAPVPAYDSDGNGNGFWDWDIEQTPSVIPNYLQTGQYNLFSFPVTLWQYIRKMAILGDGAMDVAPESVKGKKLLPTWRMKATVYRDTAGTVNFAWFLFTARKRAVIQ